MTIRIMQEIIVDEPAMTLLDRYFLMRFHPHKIVLDIVAAIWGTYFLWNKNWPLALLITVVLGGLGLFFTRNIDPELMAQTTLGRIGLLHKHPINFALNSIGAIALIYAIWSHNLEGILCSLSIIILGHFFGWSEVNANLRESSEV